MSQPQKSIALTKEDARQPDFDIHDRLVFLSHLQPMRKGASSVLLESATAIYEQGSRGPEMRNLLSKEISLSRSELRYRQFLANIELESFSNGTSTAQRVEVFERAVARAHGRLMIAIRALDHLDRGFPAPIKVTAHQAVVAIQGSADA